MRRSYLIFAVAAMVVASIAVWLYNTGFCFSWNELGLMLIVLLLVGFAVFVGIRNFKSEKRKQPAEDEMSVKINRKAAAWSYFVSIYMWLVIMYIADKKMIETDILFGAGIIGMGLLWVIFLLFFYFKGIKDE